MSAHRQEETQHPGPGGPARPRGPWGELREHWGLMSFYERFEQVVALALTFLISLVILVALLRLAVNVWELLVLGALDPLDHQVFQAIFGMIMTLLIAMEFKHSILRVALRRDSIIQVKTVVLIALLALARKFIVLDTQAETAATIAAMAFALLVLGVVYWLMRERDDRLLAAGRGAAETAVKDSRGTPR